MRISQQITALNNAQSKIGDTDIMGMCAQEDGSPYAATFTLVALQMVGDAVKAVYKGEPPVPTAVFRPDAVGHNPDLTDEDEVYSGLTGLTQCHVEGTEEAEAQELKKKITSEATARGMDKDAIDTHLDVIVIR